MIPVEGQPILTAAQMRAAEERAVPTPDAMYALMERAGAGVAEAVRRVGAGAEVLILCGPGNNGGDGYVAARRLLDGGHPVRVAVMGESGTDLARRARAGWNGPVELLQEATLAPVLVDSLFGTGLARPLDEMVEDALIELSHSARLTLAVDLPSGVSTDDGAVLSEIPTFDVTLALGALKPAHLLYPAAQRCGTVRLLDIGLELPDEGLSEVSAFRDSVIGEPLLDRPPWSAHKYTRGLAVVVGGMMPGAAALSVMAAMRAGAGYGLLLTDEPRPDLPHAVVQRRWSSDAISLAVEGKRAAVIVIGPGLGRDDIARNKLDLAIAADRDLVIDGDALHLLEERHFALFRKRASHGPNSVVLTPHAGEFAALFGQATTSKIEAARAAARRSGAIIVYKGPDTVVAHPMGWTRTLSHASTWLSTAGTGDVLAGAIAGVWQTTIDPVEAGVWLHAQAARLCGSSFIADDLADALTPARASL